MKFLPKHSIQYIEKYRDLREQLDRTIEHLESIHRAQIVCTRGCCDCCMNLSVFAVEFSSIVDELSRTDTGLIRFDPDRSCGYLEEGLCRIYPSRPIICRTHGLPVAFESESEPGRMEVSFCPKNFTHADPDELDFSPENTLDLSELNEQLCRINNEFLDACHTHGIEMPVRIEMKCFPDTLRQSSDGCG